MKNYTEPMIEIVAIEAADVITTSLRKLFTNIGTPGIEDGGHSDLSNYKMSDL